MTMTPLSSINRSENYCFLFSCHMENQGVHLENDTR